MASEDWQRPAGGAPLAYSNGTPVSAPDLQSAGLAGFLPGYVCPSN